MQETARGGVAVERGIDGVGRQHRRQRQIAAGEALGQADEVGTDRGLPRSFSPLPLGEGLGVRVRASMQGSPNLREHCLGFLQYLIVPKTHDPQTLLPKPRIATGVTCGLSMLPPIQLDDQASLMAIKIQRVGRHGMLPTEFMSTQTAIPQQIPHQGFCVGLFVAQLACEFDRFGGDIWKTLGVLANSGALTACALTPGPSPRGRGERCLLEREHRAGAAETHGDLVGDQVHPILVAQFARAGQVRRVVHRHARRALHQRLDDEGGGGGGVLGQVRFQRLCAAQRPGLGAFSGLGPPRIRRRHLHAVAQQGRVGVLEQRNIGHRQRADGFAVVAVLQADERVFLRLPCVAPVVRAHFQRDFGGRGAVRAIKRMAQPGQCSQPLGQLHHRRMRRAGQHHMFDPAELIDDRGIDARIAMAEQVDPPAGYRVQITPSAGIDQPRPLAARDRQRRRGFQRFHLGAGVPDGGTGAADQIMVCCHGS